MRNVRPSFVTVSVDNAKRAATGPKGRDGELSVLLHARDNGEAVPFLEIDAIASPDKGSVLWRIRDQRTGRILFEERIPQ